MNTKPASYNTKTIGVGLRDYFAAAAMQAIITANGTFDYDEEPVANNAYKMADAMLKERERVE